MPRPHVTPLRESHAPPPRGARVIDVPYRVINPGRRSWLHSLAQWTVAFAAAAAIGFLTPFVVVLLREIGEMLAQPR